MGNTVVVRKNGTDEVFENVLGHQVGYSHVQILFREGGQRIISNFDDIDIILDDEATDKFVKDLEMMEQLPVPEAANTPVEKGKQLAIVKKD